MAPCIWSALISRFQCGGSRRRLRRRRRQRWPRNECKCEWTSRRRTRSRALSLARTLPPPSKISEAAEKTWTTAATATETVSWLSSRGAYNFHTPNIGHRASKRLAHSCERPCWVTRVIPAPKKPTFDTPQSIYQSVLSGKRNRNFVHTR